MGRSSSLVRTLALRAVINIDPSSNLTLDFGEFAKWVKHRYSNSYSNTVLCYSRRYCHFVTSENLRELDLLPATIKNNCVKSLIVLSKFLGNFNQFTERLKSYDIKTSRPDSFSAFLRIMKASNSDILDYYHTAKSKLNPSEQVFLRYLLHSGLRVSEAITSFNLVVELSNEGKIDEYYNRDLNCLMHFKYPEAFIRKTKNCYVTFISPSMLNEIVHSGTVSYASIRKRLERKKLRMRLNEFRDKFGTHLVSNGILEIEQNLCCGRLNSGIFVKHYWSPKLAELSQRVLKALETIEANAVKSTMDRELIS